MRDDRWRGRSRDWLVAFGVAVLVLLGAVTAQPGRIPLDGAGCLLLVLSATALALRRRTPRLVLGITTACLLVYQARGYPGVVPALPTMFALYATVRDRRRWLAGAAIAAILVVGITAEVVLSSGGRAAPDVFQRWFLLIGWMVAASVAAEVARQRQAYLEQVEQRAADAERSREETARRRADEERLRIARELHDSLTHSISIIKVQAGVAVHLARKRDEPVPEALLAIQQASGEATRELRATLEVLRSDGDQPGSGLDRLENLVESARKAGLPVVVNVSGERPRPLPAPVDRAAYRIIQEALTNVTRHAGAATVAVELDYRDDALTVRIEDDGRGALGDGGRCRDDEERTHCADGPVRDWHGNGGGADVVPGVGLVGMRERVTALGGSLHVGPRDGGGFGVRAELPLGADA
ncbi:sensor histidine kinase [Plantactinospora sp. S1510]|uniref:histidine kinase n=1 Tax=Plantactinospora alkalitolerans TaxID=2789879 RepID=A0ABS0GRD6_9ACTN|nr:sensor histidine kinase [Plantactinospora alkalitolerans]MBF9128756.1 sensor histidine kinase [Plantactinospora alkalitolerans]